MAEKKKDDVYSRVTAHIVKAIEEGAAEFQMPWHRQAGEMMPVNVASAKPYRGVNVLSLWATAQEKNYSESLWGTYRQWQGLGAQVMRGEHATPVVFWQISERGGAEDRETQEGEVKKSIIAKGYYVFNVAQVEGYKKEVTPALPESERDKRAEEFCFGLGADIRHAGGAAYYDENSDHVQMPPFQAFRSGPAYYSTLLHELTHWTGAPQRLARDFSGRFGTERYAAEELVGELGAAFQMSRLGLSNEPGPEHASYVASWLSILKNDTRAIFTAAGKAEEACTFMANEHERLRTHETAHSDKNEADFEVEELGEVWRITPLTREAKRHAKADLPLERWQWVDSDRFVLHHRVARELVAQLERDGWKITGITNEDNQTRQHER